MEDLIKEILHGVSEFAVSLAEVLGSSLPPEAVEGIVAVFCISIILRILDTGPRIPKAVLSKLKRKDEEDEDEYILVRKR